MQEIKEKYPHVWRKTQQLFEFSGALDQYLNSLLTDSRIPPRQGFTKKAYTELYNLWLTNRKRMNVINAKQCVWDHVRKDR